MNSISAITSTMRLFQVRVAAQNLANRNEDKINQQQNIENLLQSETPVEYAKKIINEFKPQIQELEIGPKSIERRGEKIILAKQRSLTTGDLITVFADKVGRVQATVTHDGQEYPAFPIKGLESSIDVANEKQIQSLSSALENTYFTNLFQAVSINDRVVGGCHLVKYVFSPAIKSGLLEAQQQFEKLIALLNNSHGLSDTEGQLVCKHIVEGLQKLIKYTNKASEELMLEVKKAKESLSETMTKIADLTQEIKQNEAILANLRCELAKIAAKKESLTKDAEDLGMQFRVILRRIEEAEKTRRDSNLDLIFPAFGLFKAVITKDASRLPGVATIKTIISALTGERDLLARQLNSKDNERLRIDAYIEQICDNEKRVNKIIIDLTRQKEQLIKETANFDDNLKIQGQQLTSVQNINLSLKEISQKYELTVLDVNNLMVIMDMLSKGERLQCLLTEVQAAQNSFNLVVYQDL